MDYRPLEQDSRAPSVKRLHERNCEQNAHQIERERNVSASNSENYSGNITCHSMYLESNTEIRVK